MAKSKELLAFLKHFQANCSVRVEMAIEERTYLHWKRLVFHKLNCEEMDEISQYIKDTFSEKDRYTHLLPTIGVYNGFLCLTIDEKFIREIIMDKN